MSSQNTTLLQEQTEHLLRKKQEIERRAAVSRVQSSAATERAGPPVPRGKMSSLSRNKALLRSGMIMKNNSATTKLKEKHTVFENYNDEVKSIMKDLEAENSTEVPTTSLSGSTSTRVTGQEGSAPPNPEMAEDWFKEAVRRAKEKATISQAPAPKRHRWDSSSSRDPPSVPSYKPAPSPPVAQPGGVLCLSVPTDIMKMVGEGEHYDAIKGVMLTRITRESPVIVAYARQVFGTTQHLSDAQWRQCQDQIKMNVVFQLLQAKKKESEQLEAAGRVKFEYDSDEEVDEEGTWEHKRRRQEMQKTRQKAEELTDRSADKHHIGDFLPPEEMQKFMEKFNAIQEGRDPDFSDYRQNELKSDNIGFRMLKSMGWTEGKGLGSQGAGITQPINANGRSNNHGLGIARPDGLQREDSEYDAYRKRMMLSYRFRPNPLNNPRRPYY